MHYVQFIWLVTPISFPLNVQIGCIFYGFKSQVEFYSFRNLKIHFGCKYTKCMYHIYIFTNVHKYCKSFFKVKSMWDGNICLKISSYWLHVVGFMCICWPTIGRYGIVKRWCSYLTTTSLQLMSGQTEMWTFYMNLHWSKTSNISMISRISAILGLFSPHHL